MKPERADHREEHVREQEQAQSGDDPLGVTLDRVLQIRGSHVGVGSHLRHPEVTHHQLTLHRFQEPIGVTGRSHGRAKAEGYLHLCKIVKLPQVEQGEEDTLLPAVELVIADRPCHRHHVSGKGITMQVDIGPIASVVPYSRLANSADITRSLPSLVPDRASPSLSGLSPEAGRMPNTRK